SPNTLLAYRRDLADFTAFLATRHCPVGNARLDDITEYLATLRRRDLGARSAARRLSAIRGLYRFLTAAGQAPVDPTEHIDRPRPVERLPRTLSVADTTALVEAPDISRPDGLRDRAMLELLYAAGLRASEALALRI